jgi:putative endonuclease
MGERRANAGPSAPHLQLGAAGEEAALAEYARMGFHVVARNWRRPVGEIDLVLEREGLLVVCEVKTRRGWGMGGPFEAVTLRKQRKLRLLAEAFLARSPRDPGAVRFDVASVIVEASGRASVQLFEDAF